MLRAALFGVVTFLVAVVIAVSAVGSVQAQTLIGGCVDPATQATSACKDANNSTQTTSNNKIYGPNGILTRGAGIITYIGGIAAIIMIILAGFTFMTAGSEPAKVKVARDTLLYAVVGIIIIVIPSAIIRLVISRI